MDYELIKPDEQDAYDPAPFLTYARARRTDKQDRDAAVADVVHWWDGRDCKAAIVAGVNDPVLMEGPSYDLMAVQNFEWWPKRYVSHDEAKTQPNTWHWPES